MSPGSLALSEDTKHETCTHYWIIDTPSGPISAGSCRKCGEQREFRNIIDLPDIWETGSRHEATPTTVEHALLRGDNYNTPDA